MRVRRIMQQPSTIYIYRQQQIPARGKMSGIRLIKFFALCEWYNNATSIPFLSFFLTGIRTEEYNFKEIYHAERRMENAFFR